MWALSCAPSAYPKPTLKASIPTATVRSSSPASLPINHRYHHIDSPFAPEIVEAVESLHSEFRAVDNLVAHNTDRVLKAFQNARVGSHHFSGCTGYGHDEAGGRQALDQAFAEIVGAESAIIRSQFFSGTHAITCALFAFLRPGDELLAVAGPPYDTLEEVIGKRDSHGMGSLRDFGVKYREVSLAEDGGLDWEKLMSALKPETKCAFIQRSCGYSWRKSLSVGEIEQAIKIIKMQNPTCLVMVDNCYGEFVETIEPPMVGADLIAGSLIKNPGGTVAPCGGYVAGRERWVKAAAARLSAPGLGVDCGSTPGDMMRSFFQGLFLSPQMVGEAIKGTLLIAEVMASKGYKVQPLPRVCRHDTVQAVQLGNRERLLSFCEAVQRSSPVGSFTKPVAGTTPGYASEVIFADGTFIDGSTSELSCDGPLREPFAVFCQGGTHWTQWGLVLGERIYLKLLYLKLQLGNFNIIPKLLLLLLSMTFSNYDKQFKASVIDTPQIPIFAMTTILQISINFSACKLRTLHDDVFKQPIKFNPLSSRKVGPLHENKFKVKAFSERVSFLGEGRSKEGILVKGEEWKRKRGMVLVRFNQGFGFNGGGGGGGSDNGATTRLLGNIALAIGLTYLSVTGQLGWLLDAIVSIWLFAVLAPIVGLGAFLWWAGRDIVQDSCPNCGNDFQIFKSSLNDDLQLCPFCSQPFSVVDDKFVRDSVKFSNQSTTFGQAFNDFIGSRKGKDSSVSVVDVEAEIKDAD
ncbi:hypothetical protein FNV43_RR04064 [Rhamnella rubrinervis]|uniref:Uncharacterized protein n=1 Tax=Rhamnella rubrinervis TaxID=2594499 RepID=A0A8K0MPW3_9ROSA|nr:hypothetical protein FNV43_RR04064 [Rhamnella rubrinervis]